MKLRTLVFREIFERKSQLLTSFLAIMLGISVIVAIKSISYYSEKAVAREMDALGANILILPKSCTLRDYYGSDMQTGTLPEDYITTLATSDLEGLDNVSPKLSVPIELDGKRFTLTGILPKSEFQAKASWRGAGIFARPATGCGADIDTGDVKETLIRKRIIRTLADDEVLVGADVSKTFYFHENDIIELFGKKFKITAVLPQTGTIDDARIFAHLHVVQKLTKKDAVVNVIEVVGCCQQISKGLVDKINKLLPDAKVVTIAQIADTQIKVNKIMSLLSIVFLCIIVLVGGASIANFMYANVYERKKEIGTLMALGATPKFVLRVFLYKSLLLGAVGGFVGFIFGTALAMIISPYLIGTSVFPMPMLGLFAVVGSIAISLLASYLPARQASRIEPFICLQEI